MKKTSYDVWIFPLPSGLEIRLRDVPQEDLDFLDSIEQKTARVAELEAVLRECREALVPYMKYVDGTNVLNHPAQCVAKIDAVLPKTLG